MLTKTLLILLGLIALAVPVAAALGWLGLTMQYLESPMPLHRALGDMVWQTGTDFLLVAIPMFILLGEILLRSGIAEKMYDGIVKWLGWLPGGLMHANTGSCALFAATSGSSVATAATIGTVAIPQIERRGYNEPLFLGTIVFSASCIDGCCLCIEPSKLTFTAGQSSGPTRPSRGVPLRAPSSTAVQAIEGFVHRHPDISLHRFVPQDSEGTH